MAGPENKTTHQCGNTYSQDQVACDKKLIVDDTDIIKDDTMRLGNMVDVPRVDSLGEDSRTADMALSARLSSRRVSFVDPPTRVCSGRIPIRETTGSFERQDTDTAEHDVFEEVTSPDRIFFVEDSDNDAEVEESVFTMPTDENIARRKSDDCEDGLSDGLTGDELSSSRTFDFKPKSKSTPISIVIPAFISSLSASCRLCHSQVVVRCQLSPGGSNMPHAFSCPAFSAKWKDVLASQIRPQRPHTQLDRRLRRRYTVSNCAAEFQQQHTKKKEQDKNVDRVADLDWMHHHAPAFIQSRSRSYSDTDLSYHLMKEVGRELRRISDEFNFCYKGRVLNTVSESSDGEEEEASSSLHPSSCP